MASDAESGAAQACAAQGGVKLSNDALSYESATWWRGATVGRRHVHSDLSHWYGGAASVSSRAHALRGRRGRVGGFGSWDDGAAVSVPFDQEHRKTGISIVVRRIVDHGTWRSATQHDKPGIGERPEACNTRTHGCKSVFIKIPLIRLTIFRDETPITLRATSGSAFRM